MEIARIRVLGSTYVGLFGITNDSLTILPSATDEKTTKQIETILGTKVIKTSIYSSPLLAVFAKMNNKHIYLPSFASSREIEFIEKEIKVKVVPTENALGNLVELNDTGAIISKSLGKKAAEEIKNTGLKIAQLNIARTEVVGSAMVSTNRGFLVNQKTTEEEVKIIEETLGVKGGSSTANTGDSFVRNSIFANKRGAILGENTTPYEINRIEEALEGEQ